MRPRRCCRGSAQRSRFYPPFPLPLDFSLCLFLSATLSHCLSRSFVLSLFLSRCFHLSLFLHPPISFLFPLSFCLSLTLSLFLFLSVLLSLPLLSIFLYPLALSYSTFHSLSISFSFTLFLSSSFSQFCYRVGDSANRHCQLPHDRFCSVPIFRKSRKLLRGAANDRHAFALRFNFLVLKFVYPSVRNI